MNRFFLFILCVFFTGKNFAQSPTITLKPGAVEGQDAGIMTSYGCTAYTYSTPWENVNSGSHVELNYIDWTYYAQGCSHGTGRFLIRFVDLDSLPGVRCGGKIKKAELKLFGILSSGSWGTSYFPGSPYPLTNEGWVERVTGTWSESTVTWSTQPTVTTSNRVGIPYSGARWGWDVSLDVTTLVEDILASGNNYGFRVSLQDESIYRSVFFGSSDNTDSTKWPELVLTYDTGVVAPKDLNACIGDNITLTASGADTFLWTPATGLSNPAIANPTLTVSTTTTYIVRGKSKDGCTSYDTVTVTAKPVPTVTATPDTTACMDALVRLHASGADSFLWSPPLGLSAVDTAHPLLKISGSSKYVVEGKTIFGCKNYDTINIIASPLPPISAGADFAACIGSTVSLSASGADSFLWSPATGLSNPRIAKPTLIVTGTTGRLIVTGKTSAGCTAADTIFITPKALPKIIAGPDTILCSADNIPMYASGADTFLWTPAHSLSDPNIANPVFTGTNSVRFRVDGTTVDGCKGYDSVYVTVSDPKISASPDTMLCEGTVLQLYASGTDKYSWSPAINLSNSSIANPVLTFRGPAVYIVKGTDKYGCVDYDTINIGQAPAPVIQAIADKTIGCYGDTVRLNASGAKNYTWFPPNGLSNTSVANPVLLISGRTEYVVSGRDSAGCAGKDTILINQYPVPQVSARADDNAVSCTKSRVTLEASGAITYSWTPAVYCEDPFSAVTTVFPPHTLVFTLRGVDANGCSGEDTVSVFYSDNSVVNIPNSFTPNGDGLNDRIRPYIFCDFKLQEFAVFNRWGQQIFLTRDINMAWDGTFNGEKMSSDTYYYYIKGVNSKDEPLMLKGDITLLR